MKNTDLQDEAERRLSSGLSAAFGLSPARLLLDIIA
jgi:hypothetical protein